MLDRQNDATVLAPHADGRPERRFHRAVVGYGPCASGGIADQAFASRSDAEGGSPVTVPDPTGPQPGQPGPLPSPGRPEPPPSPVPADPPPVDPDRPPVPLEPPATPDPGPGGPDPTNPAPGPIAPEPMAGGAAL